MSDSIGIDGVWTVILGVWTDGCGIGALSSRTGSGSRTKFGIDRFRDLLFGGVTGREAGIEGRCTSDSIRNTLATRNNENIETLKKTQTWLGNAELIGRGGFDAKVAVCFKRGNAAETRALTQLVIVHGWHVRRCAHRRVEDIGRAGGIAWQRGAQRRGQDAKVAVRRKQKKLRELTPNHTDRRSYTCVAGINCHRTIELDCGKQSLVKCVDERFNWHGHWRQKNELTILWVRWRKAHSTHLLTQLTGWWFWFGLWRWSLVYKTTHFISLWWRSPPESTRCADHFACCPFLFHWIQADEKNVGLDDGDYVKLVRPSLDSLSQIGYIIYGVSSLLVSKIPYLIVRTIYM